MEYITGLFVDGQRYLETLGNRGQADTLSATATVVMTVIAAAGMATWGSLADLALVEHADQFVVNEILAGDQPGQPVAN